MSATREMVEELSQPLGATRWDRGDAADGANGTSQPRGAARTAIAYARQSIVQDTPMARQIRLGLQFLCDSYAHARELLRDPWEFAVEWPELQRLGLTCNDVRWLIHQGLAEHACEITTMEDSHRTFVPCASLALAGRCCLIVTDEGMRFVRRAAEPGNVATADGDQSALRYSTGSEASDGNGTVIRPLPTWDRDRRQLRVGAKIVKEFKVPAPNQEIVLAVFEEEKWPPKIDDPLPHQPDIDPRRRLHDTINSLNRHQRHQLMHFGADGLGQGVRWEILAKPCCREA